MKSIKKIFGLFIFFSIFLFGCVSNISSFKIINTDTSIKVGESIQIEVNASFEIKGDLFYSASNDNVLLSSDGLVTGNKPGNVNITVKYYDHNVETGQDLTYTDSINITVKDNLIEETTVVILNDVSTMYVGDTLILESSVEPLVKQSHLEYLVLKGSELISLYNNVLTARTKGTVTIVADVDGVRSNELNITILEKDIIVEPTEDPYKNVSKKEFYANYTKATSNTDAAYRTEHGFMSGDITPQDQKPSISKHQPMENNLYIKNDVMSYSPDKNTYYVVNSYGDVVNQIYRDGCYVSLEDVAAYVFAFGNAPKNYTKSKSTKPSRSIFGEYLRLNNTLFSGNVNSYPYEPVLPDISGCGGSTDYYEIDMGTTGTDCNPNYEIGPYNDGKKIIRGAARIVYTRFDRYGNIVEDVKDKHVFYTYNHYNDFQEYLNYEGGWGMMFGNITGGGSLSSHSNYNPTSYPSVSLKNISKTKVLISNVLIDLNLLNDYKNYLYL